MARLHPNIGKKQLMREVSMGTTLPKEQCSFMYEVLFDVIKQHLINGDTIGFQGIGQFYFLDRKPERSNMMGTIIPKHKQLKFKIAESFARFIRQHTREF
jgi:nucleoid DNA-binding protein